ncbi:MAG: hypothetical protein H7Y59_02540 [Anaerolineales bacterium]|nr:hypothetical protein [Anaerolineales bacterium]
MSRYIFLYTLIISLLIASCGQTITPIPLKTPTRSAPKPSPSPIPSLQVNEEWTITMSHSGGIMGLMRSIEISSDGKYTVTDGREDKTITKQLSANALSELHEIVSNTEFVSPEKSLPSGCADCFIYDLEIQHGNEKPFSVQVDDITMPGSGMEKMITHLRGLLEKALK